MAEAFFPLGHPFQLQDGTLAAVVAVVADHGVGVAAAAAGVVVAAPVAGGAVVVVDAVADVQVRGVNVPEVVAVAARRHGVPGPAGFRDVAVRANASSAPDSVLVVDVVLHDVHS